MGSLVNCTLYLLALINPVSKVVVLSVLSKRVGPRELRLLALYASLVGLGILLVFLYVGNFILVSVFHVQIYAFRIAGGVVLFLVGLKALNKGVFFEIEKDAKLAEISIVPLASPMIAGPGAITAALTYSIEQPMGVATLAVVMAVGLNLLIMLLSGVAVRVTNRFNLMGGLIRITGLIVATIAVQMILDGYGAWQETLHARLSKASPVVNPSQGRTPPCSTNESEPVTNAPGTPSAPPRRRSSTVSNFTAISSSATSSRSRPVSPPPSRSSTRTR